MSLSDISKSLSPVVAAIILFCGGIVGAVYVQCLDLHAYWNSYDRLIYLIGADSQQLSYLSYLKDYYHIGSCREFYWFTFLPPFVMAAIMFWLLKRNDRLRTAAQYTKTAALSCLIGILPMMLIDIIHFWISSISDALTVTYALFMLIVSVFGYLIGHSLYYIFIYVVGSMVALGWFFIGIHIVLWLQERTNKLQA